MKVEITPQSQYAHLAVQIRGKKGLENFNAKYKCTTSLTVQWHTDCEGRVLAFYSDHALSALLFIREKVVVVGYERNKTARGSASAVIQAVRGLEGWSVLHMPHGWSKGYGWSARTETVCLATAAVGNGSEFFGVKNSPLIDKYFERQCLVKDPVKRLRWNIIKSAYCLQRDADEDSLQQARRGRDHALQALGVVMHQYEYMAWNKMQLLIPGGKLPAKAEAAFLRNTEKFQLELPSLRARCENEKKKSDFREKARADEYRRKLERNEAHSEEGRRKTLQRKIDAWNAWRNGREGMEAIQLHTNTISTEEAVRFPDMVNTIPEWKEMAHAWKMGIDRPSYIGFGPKLGTLYTSRGAEVSFMAGILLWKRIRERFILGEEFHAPPATQFNVGGFRCSSITKTHVKVGCHLFTINEVERTRGLLIKSGVDAKILPPLGEWGSYTPQEVLREDKTTSMPQTDEEKLQMAAQQRMVSWMADNDPGELDEPIAGPRSDVARESDLSNFPENTPEQI